MQGGNCILVIFEARDNVEAGMGKKLSEEVYAAVLDKYLCQCRHRNRGNICLSTKGTKINAIPTQKVSECLDIFAVHAGEKEVV